ncbi:MAG TPA: Gfo/Idh/MocA family oxidoreductase [Terriglobia bacterium]|nr:Gfo/Idh/MocA family oxidoreductase [Terriglobia bacterium]
MKAAQVRGTRAHSHLGVGVVGCGGRGTRDATVLARITPARVVALGDLFQDQLDKAKVYFDRLAAAKGYAGVDPSRVFRGLRAYEQVAACRDVDIVLITSPPYFHPQHLEAAVSEGKHAYCEKPVAVDVNGAKRVIELGRKARGKLSLDVGLQVRNAAPFRALVRRIHSGALGRIACGEAYYYATYVQKPSWPKASPAEARIRNWIYDRVLSGDIIVEQDIHVIDACNWTLEEHPLKAVGSGRRAVRPDAGNVYGQFEVIFHYPRGVAVTFGSTQFEKTWWDVRLRFFGSRGVSESPYWGPVTIKGEEPWTWATMASSSPGRIQPGFVGALHDNLSRADQAKMKLFVKSILSGQYHNQAALGAESTLTAILGRTAAYRGREITWNELMKMDMNWRL